MSLIWWRVKGLDATAHWNSCEDKMWLKKRDNDLFLLDGLYAHVTLWFLIILTICFKTYNMIAMMPRGVKMETGIFQAFTQVISDEHVWKEEALSKWISFTYK